MKSAQPEQVTVGTKVTVYESALGKIVATHNDWGVEVVFFGNFEMNEPAAIKKIIDWFAGLSVSFIYFDFRNTLSVDEGMLGLILVILQIGNARGIASAIIIANSPANKIAIAFKNLVLNSPTLRVLHSPQTFILSAQKATSETAAQPSGPARSPRGT